MLQAVSWRARSDLQVWPATKCGTHLRTSSSLFSASGRLLLYRSPLCRALRPEGSKALQSEHYSAKGHSTGGDCRHLGCTGTCKKQHLKLCQQPLLVLPT